MTVSIRPVDVNHSLRHPQGGMLRDLKRTATTEDSEIACCVTDYPSPTLERTEARNTGDEEPAQVEAQGDEVVTSLLGRAEHQLAKAERRESHISDDVDAAVAAGVRPGRRVVGHVGVAVEGLRSRG